MKTVRDILRVKGDGLYSATPDMSVYDALKTMADKNVGALLVLDAGTLVGIFSERDYARKVILKGKSSRDITVSDIMTPNVIAVKVGQTIEECMGLMSGKHIRHLPVFEEERLIGIISISDVVKTIIAEQQSTINQLEEYIVGRR